MRPPVPTGGAVSVSFLSFYGPELPPDPHLSHSIVTQKIAVAIPPGILLAPFAGGVRSPTDRIASLRRGAAGAAGWRARILFKGDLRFQTVTGSGIERALWKSSFLIESSSLVSTQPTRLSPYGAETRRRMCLSRSPGAESKAIRQRAIVSMQPPASPPVLLLLLDRMFEDS